MSEESTEGSPRDCPDCGGSLNIKGVTHDRCPNCGNEEAIA